MKKNFLNSIDVKSPCSESWDEMFGNDEVLFCSHCAKDVHNISAMNRADAEKLVKKSNGGLCVRYVKTPQGELVNAPPKLATNTRRATIAASVLATTLSLSTIAYSQGGIRPPEKDKTTQSTKDKSPKDESKQDYSVISGTVADQNRAVIPGAKISLLNLKTKEIRSLLTNDEGIYEFKGVESSNYELHAESPGFKKLVMQNIEISKDSKLEKNLTLEVSEAKISEERTKQKPLIEISISELPINDRNFSTIMGFFPVTTAEEKPKTEKPAKPKKKKN